MKLCEILLINIYIMYQKQDLSQNSRLTVRTFLWAKIPWVFYIGIVPFGLSQVCSLSCFLSSYPTLLFSIILYKPKTQNCSGSSVSLDPMWHFALSCLQRQSFGIIGVCHWRQRHWQWSGCLGFRIACPHSWHTVI